MDLNRATCFIAQPTYEPTIRKVQKLDVGTERGNFTFRVHCRSEIDEQVIVFINKLTKACQDQGVLVNYEKTK